MGHIINGFIASLDRISEAARELPDARICLLQRGFAFLPLTENVASLDEPASEYEALDRLTKPMLEWAEAQSRQFTIAYIETEYFGGMGFQSAVVWRNGEIVFGPLQTGNGTSLSEGAINCALRVLGVVRQKALDEFDELGLGLYRFNGDWAAAGKPCV